MDGQTDRPPEDIITPQPAAGRGIKPHKLHFWPSKHTEEFVCGPTHKKFANPGLTCLHFMLVTIKPRNQR